MNLDKQLDRLVNTFVSDLRELVASVTREEVAEAIRKAVGSGGGRGGRKGRAAVIVDSRRLKRSPKQMAGQAEKLYEHIKANPGQRMEQICDALGMGTNLLQPLARRLLAEKRIKAKGKARGTTYTAA
jgi:hypothetical protein